MTKKTKNLLLGVILNGVILKYEGIRRVRDSVKKYTKYGSWSRWKAK